MLPLSRLSNACRANVADTRRVPHFNARLAALLFLVAAAACGSKADQASADSNTIAARSTGESATAAQPDSGMAGMDHSTMAGMASMGGATGNPDRDFLRMMSDHHKGMIAMAHLTIEEKKGSAVARADAEKLDNTQDAELDSMVTKLEQQFKDPYAPGISPDNQTMVDQLKAQSGAAYDRLFYQQVVRHHQQAIAMIDHHLPLMKDAPIKAMAERMKRDQSREIEEFQRKAQGR